MDKHVLDREENPVAQTEMLVAHISKRSRNLYQTRQMLCAEAVVTALNHGLGGGLTDAQAIAVAAPFCAALGESGCLCGALSGAVMASGLFLGNDHPYSRRRGIRKDARELHDAFKASNGSTCCRVLSRHVRHNKKAHFHHCADLTAQAAELAARLILQKRPELIKKADPEFVIKHQSRAGGALSRLFHFFK